MIKTVYRILFIVIVYMFHTSIAFSQSKEAQQVNSIVDAKTALEPLRYLASDELKGRGTKRPEIHVAAKYIADQLKSADVKQNDSAKNYFQQFEIKSTIPANKGSLKIGDSSLEIGKSFLQISGNDLTLTAPVVYANFASKDDLSNIDVSGKIVVTRLGINDSSSITQGLANITAKQALLKEKGAVALIETVWQDVPWNGIRSYFGQERSSQRTDSIPVFLLNPQDSAIITALTPSSQATITTSGNSNRIIQAENVIGYVPGTDAKLKNEFIVLSAHYDHIGVTSEPKEIEGKTDSIYNGARDNAIGVTAVMNAAKYFAKRPAKRSVMFILFTGEEMGLVGSKYFSEHPVLAMNKIVYNFNCDNGGYNDTTIMTVIGLGRTSVDDDIKKACEAYGVKAIADPVPHLNLFDRSDNLHFAIKGVPAPTFGMGITGFDSTIMKYYHQLADEVSSFDLNYALKYVRSYILAASNIANNPKQPTWVAGDKYEAAWKELYKK